MTSKELLKRLKNLHKHEYIKFVYGWTKFVIRRCEIDKGYAIDMFSVLGNNRECLETKKEVVEFIFGEEY